MTRRGEHLRPRGVFVATLVATLALGCGEDVTAPVPRPRAEEAGAAATAAPVMPVDLGTPGAVSGIAIDVNDGGIVVGSLGMESAGGTTANVRWLPGGTMDTVPLATVVGIGNNGSVAGNLTPCVVARWMPGSGMPGTGVTAAPTTSYAFPDGSCMTALGSSPSGGVVSGTGTMTYGPPNFSLRNPFHWEVSFFPLQHYVTNLGGMVGWRYGAAYGAANDGTTVGSLQQTPPKDGEQAFIAPAFGPIRLIGRLGTWSAGTRALAVNRTGVIVGIHDRRAVRFHDGPDFGLLLPGDAASSADAVNDKGEIVLNTGSAAYLLRGGTLVPLAGLGGTLVRANAVNERSQVVGYAYNAAGVQRPVLWDVDAPPSLRADAGGPYTGVEGAPVGFTGSATGGTPPHAFAWSFGDGGTGEGATLAHTFADDGIYGVTLDATDGTRSATATTTATIANAPPVLATGPDATIFSGETFVVRARLDDPGVDDAPWRWMLRAADSTILGTGAVATVPDSIRAPVTLRRARAHWLSLAVTDKDGAGTGGILRVDVVRLPVPIAVAPASLHAAQHGNGLLTVTVYATPTVRAADIVPASVRLGGVLAPATRGNAAWHATLEDVNGDGVRELVLKFRRADAQRENALTGIDGALVLHADLVDGRQVEGRLRWPTPAPGQ